MNVNNNTKSSAQDAKTDIPPWCPQERESLLTQVFKTERGLSVYRICLTMVICFGISSVISAIATKGRVILGVDTLLWSFQKADVGIANWSFFLLLTCLVFYCFEFWASVLHRTSSLEQKKLWNWMFVSIWILYSCIYFYLIYKISMISRLPPMISMFFLADQVKLYMKSYTFLRASAPIVLRDAKAPEKKFSSFLYYLFAPTLLYADEYPRLKCTNWKNATQFLLEFVACFYVIGFLWETLIIPKFYNIGYKTHSVEELLHSFAPCPLIGLIGTFVLGFAFLHALQNFFGEILRFGDRLFYEDYWNARGFRKFHKNWNRLVYNWIQNYVFMDLKQALKSYTLARLMVFFISGVAHEFLISLVVRSFFPLFGTLWFITSFVMYDTKETFFRNFIVLFAMQFIMGLNIFLYTLEYYASINCRTDTTQFSLLPSISRCF